MAFHEIRFPDSISRGAKGGPERRTRIVELASGDEERNASWANSRRRYDVSYGVRRADDLAAVVAFFEARNGRLHAFRFKIPWAVDRDRRSGRVGLLRHQSAQEIAMNKPSPAIIPSATIRTDLGAIFISLELSRSRLIVTSLSPGGAAKMSKYIVPFFDLEWLM